MEVVVGTYDPVLMGFTLSKDPENEKNYRFEPKFLDRGHAGCVKSVVCNEAGTIMASGSTDESIRLYSLKDHKELGSLHQHEGSVTCLMFCGNTHMLSASEDKTICVYDTKTWECLKVLKGHKGAVNSVCVHPSGRLAMSVSKDKHLRTWNLVTGRSAYVTHIKEDATIIKWSPSGDSYVLVIGNKIVLYKLATASLACTLELPRPVLAIQFLTENFLIAGGEFDGLRVFDIEKQTCIQTVTGHESRVKAIEIVHDPFPDQDSNHVMVFSVSSDGDIRAWSFNQENFKEEPSLIARYEMNGRPTCLTVSHPTKPSKKKTEFKKEKEEEKSTQENNNERHQHQQSGDEPTKKKVKKKKKGSSKKKKKQNEPETTETTEIEIEEVQEHEEQGEEDDEQMQE